MDEIEGLARAAVPLRVADHPEWVALRGGVERAERKSELRRAEDPVDAVMCAYVALYATRRPGAVTVYGDFATGYRHPDAAARPDPGPCRNRRPVWSGTRWPATPTGARA